MSESTGGGLAKDAMERIQEQLARQLAKVEADQQRKANMICTTFLQNKKRADDCDAKVAAQQQRLAEYRKAQRDMYAQKAADAAKAADRRAATVAAVMRKREEHQDALEEEMTTKLNNARKKRSFHYSTENMGAKTEASNQKREKAFQDACAKEETMLNRMEQRRIFVEEKLAQNREEQRLYLENRRMEEEAKRQRKQLEVWQQKQDWIVDKLQFHKDNTQKIEDTRKRGNEAMKERSKSTGSIRNQWTAKWETNRNRILSQANSRHEELLEKQEAQRRFVEDELGPAGLLKRRNANSGGLPSEYNFEEMHPVRWAEIGQERAAHIQSINDKLVESDMKKEARDAAQREVFRMRQEASKDLLAYKTRADAVFLRIKAEPDERKIRSAMEGLGFKMPSLPKKDGEGEEG
eukprot:TRINITY_DN57115_c0_g1_i1.p1 TRINITY_DN57115_c0_g1~~TRINITY_DN57115_c0_g1_i1.p1  ORF type:complete len:408 (-),score=119.99 TRINITY_DN57115_c0_g1_i1:69-1292(-)